MSIAVFVFIGLLFKEYKAQCLTDSGSCNSITVATALPPSGEPPYAFIQTFNVSSCLTDRQLEISEISIWFEYYTSSKLTLDFKIELFVPSPSSADPFTLTDRDNQIASAQQSVTLTKILSSSRKRATFSNLNITLGCDPLYALFVYPLDCNSGADPACDSTDALKQLDLYVCSVAIPQETLFQYNNNGAVPHELSSTDITSPESSWTDYKMDVDIVYRYTFLCIPTVAPTTAPTAATKPPTQTPTEPPTALPTEPPTELPSELPTKSPTKIPTLIPSPAPTSQPTPAPVSFDEGEVSPLRSTSSQSGSDRITPANKRGTDSIIITVVAVILSFAAIISIVGCIYKYCSHKKMTKQAISAVMETPNDTVALEDVVNCNTREEEEEEEEKVTEEELEETEEAPPTEGVQNASYIPELVMQGSAKVTAEMCADEERSASEGLWDIVPPTDQGAEPRDDVGEAITCEGPSDVDGVILEEAEGGNNVVNKKNTMGSTQSTAGSDI